MHDLLRILPPREAVPFICLTLGAGLALWVAIEAFTPKELVKPWRWGEAPRRSSQDKGLIGVVVGGVIFCLLVYAAKTF